MVPWGAAHGRPSGTCWCKVELTLSISSHPAGLAELLLPPGPGGHALMVAQSLGRFGVRQNQDGLNYIKLWGFFLRHQDFNFPTKPNPGLGGGGEWGRESFRGCAEKGGGPGLGRGRVRLVGKDGPGLFLMCPLNLTGGRVHPFLSLCFLT